MVKKNYLLTPKCQIKIGQLCHDSDGNPAIAVKRSKKDEYEKVPIPYLIETLTALQYEMTAVKETEIDMI